MIYNDIHAMDTNILLYEDILTLIFSNVTTGSTYKSLVTVCKYWNKIMISKFPKKYLELTNHLLTLLKLFPNKNWDWAWLSGNPNITFEIVKDNPDKNWDWACLSSNPN